MELMRSTALTKKAKNPRGNADRTRREKKYPMGVTIRPFENGDLERTAELVVRLKRLNGEFDPLLKTSENAEEEARKSIQSAITKGDSIILLAAAGRKVVGLVKADIVDRVFYQPRREGSILEFYILPEYRRSKIGGRLISAICEQLKKKGAELITAEFPSQNEIARQFYTKYGFRSVTNVYAKAKPYTASQLQSRALQ